MTAVAASSFRHGGTKIDAVTRRSEDRWLSYRTVTVRVTPAAFAIVIGSAALHSALVATAYISERSIAPQPPPEIEVEVIQEPPKPPPKRAAAATPSIAHESMPPAPPRRAPVTVDKAAHRPKAPVPTANDPQKIQALLKELADLKAEQAALRAERTTAHEQVPPQKGLGPMPDSFQAVALPTTTEGLGEAVGYREVVFSELAKAKGIGRKQGIPGSTAVHFEIDGAGRLVNIDIVQPSGVASLDTEALAIVRRAAPFPPPPQGARRSFVANVNFVAEP